MRYIPSMFALPGIWLVAAPFLLGYEDTVIAMRNDVTVGVAILLVATFWGIRELKEHGWSVRMLKDRDRQGRTA